uniref:Flagellar basal body protein n=1 Tax=Haemonchus contortus TaxID=6289 RepID=A0A7I5E8A4_HAECO|nr:Protein F40H3.3 [Haemonchus contortus]
MQRCYTFALTIVIFANAQFNIPIPFGNIGLKKGDDGNLEITSNEGFDLFGYGGKRKVKLVTGNGTFFIEKEDAALVNGKPFGGSGAFSFDKDRGIDIGQNVTLGNQTAVGGPGRETNFLAELLSAIKQLIPKPSSR